MTPKAYPEDEYVYEGCNCGNCHLTILSDGAVYACRRMESKVGNALTDDLYDLFTGPKARPVPGVRKIREVL